jgi:solute carrier family 8 (sodium/calcium exchanger)
MDVLLQVPSKVKISGQSKRESVTSNRSNSKKCQANIKFATRSRYTQTSTHPDVTDRACSPLRFRNEDEDMELGSIDSEDMECDPGEELDPSYDPTHDMLSEDEETTDDEYDAPGGAYVMKNDTPVQHQKKYLVFEECLHALLCRCQVCGADASIQVRHIGSMAECHILCSKGHTKKWSSQPTHNRLPWGNLFISAAMLFSGSSPTKVLTMFNHSNVPMISLRTFTSIQKFYLVPTVYQNWTIKQEEMIVCRKEKLLIMGGDARCDSPGFSSKYGSYALMDLEQNAVLDVQMVQSNEVGNSVQMELEGLKRSLKYLQETKDMKIGELVTDRHVSVKAYLKNQQKHIKHYFDVWHCAKGVTKKLEKAAKLKGGEAIRPWIRSISNHMYYVAASCGDDTKLKEEMWVSVSNHIVNVHTHKNATIFKKCDHEELDDRAWLTQGSRPHKLVTEIVGSPYLVKAVHQLSPGKQTYGLEVYHNVVNHFASKQQHYFYHSMKARVLLATLHFNENGNKPQAIRQDGSEKWKVCYPKAGKGEHVVAKPQKEGPTYVYIGELMENLTRRRLQVTSYKKAKEDIAKWMQPAPPSLTLSYCKVNKDELVSHRRSRFNLE